MRSMFGNDISKFKEQMDAGQARNMFVSLHAESVIRLSTWLTLDAQAGYRSMKIHFVQEGGQWKIYEGQMDTSDREDRVLPKMEKRSATHFDIYYFKDSTAAREIDRVAKQKDGGFEQICLFLGTHAMQGFGGGQGTIYQRARALKDKGEWIELRELLGYREIGPAESRPQIAYPEAASFVRFLIDTCGKDKFLQAYKTLRNSDDPAVRQSNVKKLEEICGQSLQTLQQQWEAVLARS